MLKTKGLSFFILNFFVFLSCFAALPDTPKHPRAELISEEPIPGREKVVYIYRAPISKEDLVRFYREMLEYQGWELTKNINDMYCFRKDSFLFILNFVYSGDKNMTKYHISLEEVPAAKSAGECESCSK